MTQGRTPRKGDASQRAGAVVQEATGQAEAVEIPQKDPAAVERGRAGGIGRTRNLTPERRLETAKVSRKAG